MSMLGLRVGPFEIVDHARVPEPGEWFHARRTGITRRQPTEVLLRVLPPDASAEDRAALQRDFESLRGIDDPRVPGAVAFYEGSGAMAIALVHGVPLGRAIEGRRHGGIPMTPATLLDLALELAETLQRLHHRGRHHGHLSPEIIWLGPEGRVWIFGLAGAAEEPQERWCAPERARGNPPAMAADQWALGAIIASMISGHPPWRSEDVAAEARRGDPESMIAPVERQWPALGRLLRRMLDPHPQNRFASLHPVRQELLALSRKAGSASARRELGAALSALHGSPDTSLAAASTDPGEAPAVLDDDDLEPPPPRDDPPSSGADLDPTEVATNTPVQREVGPTDDADPPSLAVASVEEDDAPAGRQRRAPDLPAEEFDVVSPAAGAEHDLPVARLGTDPGAKVSAAVAEPSSLLDEDETRPLDPALIEAVRARLAENEPQREADLEPSEATVFMDSAEIAARAMTLDSASQAGGGLGLPGKFEAMARDPMDPPTVPPHPDDEVGPTVQMNRSEVFATAGKLVAQVQFEDTDPGEVSTSGTAIPVTGSRATGAEDPSVDSPPRSDPTQSNWIPSSADPPSLEHEPGLGSMSSVSDPGAAEPSMAGGDSDPDVPTAPAVATSAFPIQDVAPWLVAAMLLLLVIWVIVRLS
ncbi:MAG: serine/threonine protein kinase [Myxococcota bacterium]|jgi:serine/threonine protein kinase